MACLGGQFMNAWFLFFLLLARSATAGLGLVSEPLIVGGSEVREADDRAVLSLPDCTGFLLRPRLIATAAHCIAEQPERWQRQVRIGNSSNGKRRRNFAIQRIHLHPWYHEKSVFDIAFIELEEDLAKALQIAEIPPLFVGERRDYQALQQSNTMIRVVGYGKNERGYTEEKKQASLRFRNFYFDLKDQRSLFLRPWTEHSREGNQELWPSSYVLSWQRRDTCPGDSGGPGFILVDGKEQYLGLTVGGGRRCGRGKNPSIYRLVFPSICSFPDIIERHFPDQLAKACQNVQYWQEP